MKKDALVINGTGEIKPMGIKRDLVEKYMGKQFTQWLGWNEVMEIVQKIRQLEAPEEGVGITVFEIKFEEKNTTRCMLNYRIKFQGISSKHKWIEHTTKSPLESVWKTVSDFIEWYSKIKK